MWVGALTRRGSCAPIHRYAVDRHGSERSRGIRQSQPQGGGTQEREVAQAAPAQRCGVHLEAALRRGLGSGLAASARVLARLEIRPRVVLIRRDSRGPCNDWDAARLRRSTSWMRPWIDQASRIQSTPAESVDQAQLGARNARRRGRNARTDHSHRQRRGARLTWPRSAVLS